MTVAVGVIFNSDNEILLVQRPLHKPFGGLWEFPGGKIEPSETASQALQRELIEELGIEVKSHTYLGCIAHDYAAQQVKLNVYQVDSFVGTPYCRELQPDMRWVSLDAVDKYPLLEATLKVHKLLLIFR